MLFRSFLVDEVGLLPLSTLGAMSKWQCLGAKFMFFGDFEGQFEPFRDRWDMDLRNGDNDLMHQLCNGYRVQLQTYRRGTDPQLFAWFCSLYGQQDARGLANESRARYPAACDPRANPLVLCLSHKKRMRVNARQNELLKPPHARHCEWQGEDPVGTAAAKHARVAGARVGGLPPRLWQAARGAGSRVRGHWHGPRSA